MAAKKEVSQESKWVRIGGLGTIAAALIALSVWVLSSTWNLSKEVEARVPRKELEAKLIALGRSLDRANAKDVGMLKGKLKDLKETTASKLDVQAVRSKVDVLIVQVKMNEEAQKVRMQRLIWTLRKGGTFSKRRRR
jgi:hypothetical protein